MVLFSHLLFELGLCALFGVKAPISLSPPGIYTPLFWAGLWGILFGIFIKTAWKWLYLFGLLYFIVPLLALYIIFLPMKGAGFFGIKQGGPKFTVFLLMVNLPYGVITASVAFLVAMGSVISVPKPSAAIAPESLLRANFV